MADDVVAGSMRELAALYPIPSTVEIAGRKVDVPVCGVRRCGEVMQHWLALSATMASEGADEVIFADEHPGEFADLLVLAVGCDRTWAVGIGPLEKIDLFLEWNKVNADFFVRGVLATRRRLQDMAIGLSGAGLIPSTDSKTPVTSMPNTTPRAPSISSSLPPSATNSAA